MAYVGEALVDELPGAFGVWADFVAVFAGPAAGAVEDVLGTCGASWGRAEI